MGLSRRRDSSMIWPGFVDAVTTLLMVLMFVLTIFTVMQSVLQETITTQDSELDSLTAQVASLADTLGLERAKVASLEAEGARQEQLIAQLTGQIAARDAELADAKGQITSFQAQVAALIAERDATQATLEATQADLKLSEESLLALTLKLEEERKKAEETLLLLAAAETDAARAVSDAEKREAALAAAQKALTDEQAKSLESARNVALLNQQVAALRAQLAGLQAVLDASKARDAAAKVQVERLGADLNAALAQVAQEQKRRAELEEAERKRLEAENQNLAKFRSEFFGQLSALLAGREGVRVVGDRFVFSSEVLFAPGQAVLSPEGQVQIAGVVEILDEVRGQIPDTIDWIIRVDGHTDNVPLGGGGQFIDNWELSQARALSVVRYMQEALGFPPDRLAATGFGEYRPVATDDTEQARAQNRRIELKLTER